MKEFKHIVTGDTAREQIEYPSGNRVYRILGIDCFLPARIIENSKDWQEQLEFSVNNIHKFANGWRPINELNYKEIEHDKIRIWCVYPGGDGGHAKDCKVEHVIGTYIYCEVKFYLALPNSAIRQYVVAYHPDNLTTATPFINSDHEKIWRQAALISTSRQIKYE